MKYITSGPTQTKTKKEFEKQIKKRENNQNIETRNERARKHVYWKKNKNTKPHHRNNIKNLICLQYLFHSNNKNATYSHTKKSTKFL